MKHIYLCSSAVFEALYLSPEVTLSSRGSKIRSDDTHTYIYVHKSRHLGTRERCPVRGPRLPPSRCGEPTTISVISHHFFPSAHHCTLLTEDIYNANGLHIFSWSQNMLASMPGCLVRLVVILFQYLHNRALTWGQSPVYSIGSLWIW